MGSPAPVVFVVDDDPAVLGYLERLVTSVGLSCEAYASGDEFIQHLDTTQCGCAILDVRMPGLSGLDTQQFLVDHGIPLPVIFVTGFADVSIAVRAMKAGAVDVFVKPVNSQELLDSVHRAIEIDRRRLDAQETAAGSRCFRTRSRPASARSWTSSSRACPTSTSRRSSAPRSRP